MQILIDSVEWGDKDMTLTDLQVQLRSIEQSLSVLQTEIEKMKPKASAENKQNFEKITRQAKQFPIENETLLQQDKSIRKSYIAGLSYLLNVDHDGFADKLMYLCRISYGVNLSLSAEEIIQLGMQFESEDLEKFRFDLTNCAYNFLVDGLTIAGLTGQPSETLLSIITDFAQLLGCDKEDLCVTSYIAKANLTQNMEFLNQSPVTQIKKDLTVYRSCVPTAWIEATRIECGKYELEDNMSKATRHSVNILFSCFLGKSYDLCIDKSIVQSNTLVQKGDAILLYKHSIEEKKLFSPANGRVIFIENEETGYYGDLETQLYVYVVSYFDDEKSVQEWHKKRNKGE